MREHGTAAPDQAARKRTILRVLLTRLAEELDRADVDLDEARLLAFVALEEVEALR